MSDRPAERTFNLITSLDWAMTPDYLDLFCAIALRENDPLEAVERRLGTRLENSRSVTVRDGVATIPIQGPIFRYANIFTRYSGGATIDVLARDIDAALTDPAISGIVLDIDSPGGEINGINETAEMIYAARNRKPITAYVGHLGASAAYWLAAAAERVVVDDTAMLGSIGVLMAVRDPARTGSRDIVFRSSQSPRKHVDPGSDEGRDEIQTRLDALADVFIDRVARNRGVDVETVMGRFGQGGVLVGRHAVDAGMADAIGSYEGVLAALTPRPYFFIQEVPMGTEPIAAAQNATAAEQQAQAEAELVALRQQLATERRQRIDSEAVAFVEQAIHGNKAFPGERDSLIALYRVCAGDDADHPRDGQSRVELLRAAVHARPGHALTQERVPVEGTGTGTLTVQTNPVQTPAPADANADVNEAADHARRYAERQNGKKVR
jgi:ClpP class serine protease